MFRCSSRRDAWIELSLAVLFCAFSLSAFGNRVSKTASGATTQYLVDDGLNPTGLPQVIARTEFWRGTCAIPSPKIRAWGTLICYS
jgi:hypothetical protein